MAAVKSAELQRPWLTVDQVASILRVKSDTTQELIYSRSVPAVDISIAPAKRSQWRVRRRRTDGLPEGVRGLVGD